MLFNSFEFLFFFPVVTLLYFMLPHRFRWLLLLIASCVFYAAFIPAYILILFLTIVIDYFAGMMIEQSQGRKRKWYLILSIISNVGILAVFKYYNFFIENINEVLHQSNPDSSLPLLAIVLPIGLSFHTFQAMSYTIEVYRGNFKAERHFGIYALYVMFYPQLVAGPIERPQNVLPQFRIPKNFDYARVTDGLKLMAWGLFKKVVIADRLAQFTDPVFDHPADHQPISLVLAAFFFSFQIFCDFSGYSDIALGSAKVMGFKLMTNFDRPYSSTSISEFWKRWHISLSSWFRDYLYIPLGGNRVAIPRVYFNLLFVFVVSGFWHGANWTFMIWGALHGVFLVLALVFKPLSEKFSVLTKLNQFPILKKRMNILITFALVTFAWIFFRAKSVAAAWLIIRKVPAGIHQLLSAIKSGYIDWKLMPVKKETFFISIALIFFLELIHYLQSRGQTIQTLQKKPAYLRWLVYYSLGFAILFLGVFENRQFIYFQF